MIWSRKDTSVTRVQTWEELSGVVGTRWRRAGRRRLRPGEARALRAANALSMAMFRMFDDRYPPTVAEMVTAWRYQMRRRRRVLAMLELDVMPNRRPVAKDVCGRVFGR